MPISSRSRTRAARRRRGPEAAIPTGHPHPGGGAPSVAGGVNRTARTERGGRFTITFPGGEGDYYVSFASIGYAPRRFEVKRTADHEKLVRAAQHPPNTSSGT